MSSINPIESAHQSLIAQLSALRLPKAIRLCPGPSDFEAVAETLNEVAKIFNAYIEHIGFHVAENCTHSVDMRSFEGAGEAALDSAIYECRSEAEALIDERRVA
jgi:hypothetical protein